jgi:hypothetical protein
MVKKALLIGINYKGTSAELNGCINDVYNVKNFLSQNCEYKPENMRVLTDNDILPTNKAIKDNIAWLLSGVSEGDTLFFHYSGHGSNIADTNGDETDKRDETLVPIDYNTAGMITDDWLFENFITRVPKGANLWALMDACHSGTLLDLRHNYTSICKLKPGKTLSEPYIPENWTNVFRYSTQRSRDIVGNIYMFSGALDPQYAADAFINGNPQGAFTACFLECLNNNLSKLKTTALHRILKEINVRLEMKRFLGQRSQLSVSKKENYKSFLNF